MKRTFNFGKIDYLQHGRKDCLVTIDIELRERGGEPTFVIDPNTKQRIPTGKTTPRYTEFSACGKIWNHRKTDIYRGGQCLDTIAATSVGEDPLFKKIYRLWNLYHLNGMHPECEHQEAEGWNEIAAQKVTMYTFTQTIETIHTKRKIEERVLACAAKNEPHKLSIKQRYILGLDYSITTHLCELPDAMKPFYELSRKEEKALGWMRESEHPSGILGRACPVCGYRYGSAWLHRDIPAADLAEIQELIAQDHE